LIIIKSYWVSSEWTKTKYYWICKTTSLFFRINWILLFRFFRFFSISFSSIIQIKTSMMLKWLIQEESFLIQSINAALFKILLNCSKKNKIKVFALFMMNINRKIAYNTQCNLNALNVFLIDEMTQNLKDIKAKLSSKYHEFLDVFDRAQLNKLSSHCFYNHKIELINDSTFFHCWVY